MKATCPHGIIWYRMQTCYNCWNEGRLPNEDFVPVYDVTLSYGEPVLASVYTLLREVLNGRQEKD